MTTRRLFAATLGALLAAVAGAVTTVVPGAGEGRGGATSGIASHRKVDPISTPQAAAVPRPPISRPPALLAREVDEDTSRPIALERARYEVLVTGLSARTRATFVFRNDRDRVLEGELVFPLPEGALVSGYALDVNGTLVDGVVVEAQQARVAFETETRRRVDPGLVEWVRGSNFRTRVWPIPPRGRRTIAVEYLADLATRPADGRHEAVYELPLRFDAPLEELALRVEVAQGDVAPTVRSGLANLTFERWQNRFVAETTRRDVQPGDDLRVGLPDVPRARAIAESNDRGETFFVVDDFPTVPAGGVDASGASRIAVVWDASLSRREADLERDLNLLAAHVRGLGDVEVDVLVFRDVPSAVKRFAIRGGDASALLTHLREEPYDGATNLAALRIPDEASYALLFSDGLSTIGAGDPVPSRPAYVLSGDPRADHGRLRSLAERSGGAYFNLQRYADADVLAQLGRPVFSLLGVEASETEIADLEPAGAQAVSGGRVRVAGRLLAAQARLTLRYGLPGSKPTEVRTVTIRRSPAGSTALVDRLWAQQRLTTLAADPERNREDLVRLGQRFSLVTPGTSLLVLETLEQYLAHDVTPPASQPELRSAFLARRREEGEQTAAKQAGKVERVVEMWQRRVAWWERESFPQAKVRELPPAGVADVERRRLQELPASSPTAPPPPLPAATDPGRLESNVRDRQSMALESVAAAGPASGGRADAAAPAPGPTGPSIVLQAWNPDTPYLRSIEKAPASSAYAVYLAERNTYGGSPAFYLDCADVFFKRGQRDLGLRILTSVAELRLEDARLLRVLAHRLEQVDALDLAVEIFDHVRRLRPEEPQSHRDLALALDRRAGARAHRGGRIPDESADDYGRALTLLGEVVRGDWDARFPEIEVIALEEANRIASMLERGGARRAWPLDPRLRKLLDVDVRIVLTWDTDNSDMDLWVIEPGGERCFYSYPLTSIGGAISRDFTGGYGPETYAVRRASGGQYDVKANFYGTRSQSLTGPTTVQATVITDYGRPGETRRALTVRLGSAREVVDVGSVTFKKPVGSS